MTVETCHRCKKDIHFGTPDEDGVTKLGGGLYYHTACFEKRTENLSDDELQELRAW